MFVSSNSSQESGELSNLVPRLLCCRGAIWAPLAVLLVVFADGLAQTHAVDRRTGDESSIVELSGGQTYSRQITVGRRQHVRLVIRRRNIPLSVKIYGPDNTMLTDRQNRLRDSAVVSLISDLPCSYRFEISSLEEQPVAGSFEIGVSEARTATSKDKRSLAGERAFDEGEQLQINGRLEATRRAVRKYEAASRYWRLAGDRDQEAHALKAIGEVWFSQGNLAKAFEYFNYCDKLSTKTTDTRLRGGILSALGLAHSVMGDNARAMKLCAEALETSKNADHPRGVARATHCLGEIHYSLRDARTAAAYYRESLDLWIAAHDRRGEAQARLDLGHILSEQGEAKSAQESFQRAVELWRKVKDLRGEAQTLVALGNLASRTGSKQEALDFYQAADEILDETGDLIERGRLLNGKAYVYDQWEEKTAALRYYDLAAQAFHAAGYLRGEVGSLITIAGVQTSMSNYDKALGYLRRALIEIRRLKDINLESYALKIVGDVYGAMGGNSRAVNYYNQALALFRKGNDRRGEAYALKGIGEVYSQSGDKAEALRLYRQALDLNRSVNDRFGESSTLYGLARLEAGEGEISSARASVESAIRIIELLRANVGSPDLRASYFAAARRSYDLYIDLLMRQHVTEAGDRLDAAAFHAAERVRARGLLESIVEGGAEGRSGVESALLERERTLREELSRKVEERARLLAASPGEARMRALGGEIDQLALKHREAQAQIRVASPGYESVSYATPATVSEIQELLDADTLLLEYALGDERSYLWAIDRSSLKSFELGPGKRIETAARRVYELLTTRNREVRGETALRREIRIAEADNQYSDAESELSEMLLSPAAPLLEKKRLVIVADGILQYIPFAALPRPNAANGAAGARGVRGRQLSGAANRSPLFLKHEIVNLPSSSTLKALRSALPTRDAATKALAVFADPVFSRNDARLRGAASLVARARRPARTNELIRAIRAGRRSGPIERLPHSGTEADDICATAPGGCDLKAVDFLAAKDLANSRELSQYRVIHFATHSLLNSEHPDLSGIVLSLVNERGQPRDGFLQLHEIYGMRLSADLVVLSACQTALGKDVRGEGLVGLTRGFLSAGAAQVVSSLWKVDDRATAELMREFYKNLPAREGRPAAALRAAQMYMASTKRWGKSPYYWAGFCLQGDWSQTVDPSKQAER